MNVLVASHSYPSHLSILAGSFVHNQVRFLSEHCQIRSVSPTPWFPFPGFGRWSAHRETARREMMDGIEVLRPRYVTYPRRLLLSGVWRSYLRALRGVASGQVPDVIHAHYAYPDGLAAVHYGQGVDRPVVITVHGHDMKDLSLNPQWRPLVAEALGRAAAVIAVSGELARLVEELGVSRDRIKQIPNGVDCTLFKLRPNKQPGQGGWKILYVGRYDPAKGIGVLLDAAARLCAAGHDIQVTLVGGSASTGRGESFRRQASELKLQDRVRFLDEVPSAELPRHMGEADLFVLPSFSEGLPLVLVEALASGLPVVVTPCGGPEEVVREDESVGRLAQVGDPVDLERQIAHVIAHYDDYDRQAIRQFARERYDYRTIASSIKDVYDEVVAAR